MMFNENNMTSLCLTGLRATHLHYLSSLLIYLHQALYVLVICDIITYISELVCLRNLSQFSRAFFIQLYRLHHLAIFQICTSFGLLVPTLLKLLTFWALLTTKFSIFLSVGLCFMTAISAEQILDLYTSMMSLTM